MVSIEEFFALCGLSEDPLRPGERRVVPVRLEKPGSSYSIVYDWRTDREKIRISVKPGLTGKDLPPEKMRDVAVCLQAPLYVEIDVLTKGE